MVLCFSSSGKCSRDGFRDDCSLPALLQFLFFPFPLPGPAWTLRDAKAELWGCVENSQAQVLFCFQLWGAVGIQLWAVPFGTGRAQYHKFLNWTWKVKTLSLCERLAKKHCSHFSHFLPNPSSWGLPEPFPSCQGHKLKRPTGLFFFSSRFLGGSWMVLWLLQVNAPSCALRDVGAPCGGHYLWHSLVRALISQVLSPASAADCLPRGLKTSPP